MRKILVSFLLVSFPTALLTMEGRGADTNNGRMKKLEMDLDRLAEKSIDDLFEESVIVQKEKQRLESSFDPKEIDFETIWLETVKEKGYLDISLLKRTDEFLLSEYKKELKQAVDEDERKLLQEKINKLNNYKDMLLKVENMLDQLDVLKEPIEM